MRRVTASLIGLLIASPLLAQEPVTQERQHVVRHGDTLWDLASHYLSDPFAWRTIYHANTGVVENPDFIYPDEVLTIPGARTTARRRAAPADPGQDPVPGTRARPEVPLRTVFYRPPPPSPQQSGDPTVLSEAGFERTPVRPGEFAAAPYLTNPDGLEVRAFFMRSVRKEDQDAAESTHPEDRVYLNYAPGVRPQVGERLSLVDIGDRVEDAGRENREVHPKAVVRIVELGRDIMIGEIEELYGQIVPERQRLIPVPMFPDFRVEAAEPVEGGADLEGRLLEFVLDQPLPGRSALAFIDLGRRHGVHEGDIFEAYAPPRTVRERRAGELRARSQRVPAETIAELRVIRVTDSFATVRVDDLRRAGLEPGLAVRRVSRIP